MNDKNGLFNVSLVIPVYNSQESLGLLLDEIVEVMDKNDYIYEVILVNDGSQDQSWEVIKELTKQHNFISGYNLMRNYGQHNALLCGIREARYSIIVTLDDDLQNPPSEIPKLLATLNEGYDVVYGYQANEKHGLWRIFASKLIKFIMKKAMKVSTAQNISAFRAFRTNLRDAFINYQGTHVSIDVLLSWGTTKFTSIKVNHSERKFGTSKYTLKKLITHALTLITGFSILPLQISSFLGFISFIFGFAILIYVLIRYLSTGGTVPGFTFLASTIAIFSGVQLFSIGMIGEYLGRVFTRSLDYPSYTVRSNQSSEDKTEGEN